MKAGVVFTGSGPILMLTSYKSFLDPTLLDKLKGKGMKKFIVYEVPTELVKMKYGNHFDVVMEDLRQEDDLRVVDYNGNHVFSNFRFQDMGKPIYCEDF